jgi:hypothetical protein
MVASVLPRATPLDGRVRITSAISWMVASVLPQPSPGWLWPYYLSLSRMGDPHVCNVSARLVAARDRLTRMSLRGNRGLGNLPFLI